MVLTATEVGKMKVDELKSALKKFGESIVGKKAELSARLLAYLSKQSESGDADDDEKK